MDTLWRKVGISGERKGIMFVGEFLHSIDNKGRLAVPIKFRAALAEGAVVTKGLDKCLFLYTSQEWSKWAERINSLSLFQSNARAFSRLVLGGAMEVLPDKQGRINLPKYLISYAGIKNSVVVVGLSNRLEIWDSKAWQEYKKKTEKDPEATAEQLFI